MKIIDRFEIKKFQEEILDWYGVNGRDLPWRRTREPYRILVSEVMLQQAQVERAVPKYDQWLKCFPTVGDLANGSIRDVLRVWSGLGYNRRALYLHKTAKIIMKDLGGKIPDSEKLLRKLQGIGQYTARAILCFAFDKQVAVVDTNVRKVVATRFLIQRESKKSKVKCQKSKAQVKSQKFSALKINNKEILNVAEQLLPGGRAYEWNQALMDYAGVMLKGHKIPIPKQTKFLGSRRYYRGQVLKMLLKKKNLTLQELGVLLKPDYSFTDEEWFAEILIELRKEGFIELKGDRVTLV